MSSQADINSVNYDAAVAARDAAMFAGSPHVVLKPRIFPDGDMWCVLLGEDLQIGVCGFGETPVKACLAFDQAWYHSKTPDAALAAPRTAPAGGVDGWQGVQADETRIAAWVRDRFGPDSLINAIERADRLLEEALEMQQAVYAEANEDPAAAVYRANKLVDHVYSKEPGDPRQEMGGVMTCALALGHRLGVRLDIAAQAELTRIEALSKEHFDKRHQAKVDAGVAAQHERPTPARHTDDEGAQ